ncbi:unnamed protein product [Peronospora effusa]|nr:unnamed protein product [Peronospora effusa]
MNLMGLLVTSFSDAVNRFSLYYWYQLTLVYLVVIMMCHNGILVSGSIHQVHEQSTGCKVVERMFADGYGPFGLNGRSSVRIDVTLRPLDDLEVQNAITVRKLSDYFDFGVVVTTYTTEAALAVGFNDHTACSWNFDTNETMEGVLKGKFCPLISGETLQMNTTFYPRESGLQTALVMPCWKQKNAAFGYPVSTDEFVAYPLADPLLHVDATIGFKNPYGYLPGLLYGLFPFNGVLSLMYVSLGVYFVVLMKRHRQSVVGVHFFLLMVLLLATGESVAWFVTYKLLNDSGVPACCPYPDSVLFSTFVKVLAGMVARIATTLVSLGYGIVRMQVSWPEVFVVSGLGICYFIAVGALEVSHLANQSDGDIQPPAIWEALVIVTNACFGGWIFVSLELTRKNLIAFGQTEKSQMYDSLHWVLLSYVIISFVLMAIEGAVYSGATRVPWQYTWIVWAATRLLFFVILLVGVYLWRPREHGLLYAQMDQLSSCEPVTPTSISRSNEMNQRVASAADDENSILAKPSPSTTSPTRLASSKNVSNLESL